MDVPGHHRVPQVEVPASSFLMGNDGPDANPGDGEGPVHAVQLSAFSIDATTVTNADFGLFIDATGYRTEAELFGFSAVFHQVVEAEASDIMGRPSETPWWVGVRGADWLHPEGARSQVEDRADHPVVHVSWTDAQAYCRWAGRALPTEAQWECAARGGLEGLRYPWGDLVTDQPWPLNIWQGQFPDVNTLNDGWLTTAPARSYEPQGYGLWQMIGNVWEWCADWWQPGYYADSPAADPVGPEAGRRRVLRGGSYLCHASYCNRYRNAARSANTPDSSMGNAGFRTVGLTPP